MTSDSLINVSDRYIDLEGIKEETKHPASYTYRPLSSLGFMDESQDGRSDVIKLKNEFHLPLRSSSTNRCGCSTWASWWGARHSEQRTQDTSSGKCRKT